MNSKFAPIVISLLAFAIAGPSLARADSWSAGTAMPTARQGAAAGVIGKKIYVVGGATGSAVVAVNQVYNTATGAWRTRAPMPTARFVPASAVVGRILYVLGGIAGAES
jgi:Kelch motif